jgi:hypothetical protein
MNSSRSALGIGLLAAVLGLAGCPSGPSTMNDAGNVHVDSGPVVQPVVMTTAGTVDLSCVGTASIPTPGAATAGTLHAYEFLSMANITSNAVDIFTNNDVTDGCDPPNCATYNTDASGNFSLTLGSDSWFAYRLHESGQTAAVIAYNQPWTLTDGSVSVPGFAPMTITEVGMLLGRTFDSSRFGSMSGRAIDCQGHVLGNVRVRVYADGTEVISGTSADPTSPRITGLEAPNPTRPPGYTGASGNFVGANIPPTSDCRVETWATLAAGEEPRLIGCIEGRVLVGGITLSIVGPLRSDYPAGSGCAMAAAAAAAP